MLNTICALLIQGRNLPSRLNSLTKNIDQTHNCFAIFYNFFLLTMNKSPSLIYLRKVCRKVSAIISHSYPIVGALANRTVILVRAETVITLHLAIVQ